MALKIKAAHLITLAAAIRAVLVKHPGSMATYRAQGFSEKRLRWDLLYAAEIDGISGTSWIVRELYSYLNDDHIDSALRKILTEVRSGS